MHGVGVHTVLITERWYMEVSKGLATGYYSRGLDTPYEIGRVYCPPSASSWAGKVTYLMNEIGE